MHSDLLEDNNKKRLCQKDDQGLFEMLQLRKKIDKIKDKRRVHDKVRAYNHNFGECGFHKSLGFRSTDLDESKTLLLHISCLSAL